MQGSALRDQHELFHFIGPGLFCFQWFLSEIEFYGAYLQKTNIDWTLLQLTREQLTMGF